MYKIINDKLIQKGDTYIPRNEDNKDYRQFVEDVVGIGTTCVEGADYVGVTSYTEARAAEYPRIEEQLDNIYHYGIDALKAEINATKYKYPKTQVGITPFALLPVWLDVLSTYISKM